MITFFRQPRISRIICTIDGQGRTRQSAFVVNLNFPIKVLLFLLFPIYVLNLSWSRCFFFLQCIYDYLTDCSLFLILLCFWYFFTFKYAIANLIILISTIWCHPSNASKYHNVIIIVTINFIITIINIATEGQCDTWSLLSKLFGVLCRNSIDKWVSVLLVLFASQNNVCRLMYYHDFLYVNSHLICLLTYT